MQGDKYYGDPIFYLKFFQGRIYSCQLHQVWKKLCGTSFQKNNLPEKLLRGRNNKGLKYV